MNFLNANTTAAAATTGGVVAVCAVEGAAEGDSMSLGGSIG